MLKILTVLLIVFSPSAQAADGPPPGGGEGPGKPENKASKPEEDDYTGTPFTEYGEFNEATDEEDDTKFLQFGRLFGVSLGGGFQFVDGFRGALWQGGFPTINFRLHYWFSFHVALDLGLTNSSQYYQDTSTIGRGHVDVNLMNIGMDLKYYFDTKNLSAAISFASPYLLAGVGTYSKTENSIVQQGSDSDTSLGLALGGGIEFAISPRKFYFSIEGKINVVSFKDTYTQVFSKVGLPNLTGNFYTATGNLLFTW
jgi:opacity protein-like surface antigen